ncbi:MAG: hypothetical protein ACLQEQ_06800 [Nitrososphaerales archaeon]
MLGISQPIAAILFGFFAGVTSSGLLFIESGVALMLVTLLLYIPLSRLRRAKY